MSTGADAEGRNLGAVQYDVSPVQSNRRVKQAIADTRCSQNSYHCISRGAGLVSSSMLHLQYLKAYTTRLCV
jgi:hypothetical protein